MGRHKLFYKDAKVVRDTLNAATELADKILAQEVELVGRLAVIDGQKYYVRYGYRSLSGFCTHGLKLSKTQTQRIVTQVRRSIPTANIVVEGS